MADKSNGQQMFDGASTPEKLSQTSLRNAETAVRKQNEFEQNR